MNTETTEPVVITITGPQEEIDHALEIALEVVGVGIDAIWDVERKQLPDRKMKVSFSCSVDSTKAAEIEEALEFSETTGPTYH